MELREFVKETLVQIISGVADAQSSAEVESTRSAVAPSGQGTSDRDTLNQDVTFDVALTTTDKSLTKGGVGVFVGAIGLGSQGQSDSSRLSLSRVQFTVPIYLPSQNLNRSPVRDSPSQ